jgi:DNA-binding NarL/FixJ family response regulator
MFKSSLTLKKKIEEEPIFKCHLYIIASNPLIAGALKHSVRPGIAADIISHDQLRSLCTSTAHDDPMNVFLLDEGMMPGWPHQCLRLVSSRFTFSKKIILGEDFTTEQAFSWLLEGIHGFLRYSEVESELNKALCVVIGGHLWIKPETMETMCIYMQRTWKANKQSAFSFTHRQKQIIDMVRRKLSNKEIANHLGISENTVKFHLAKVFSKLGTRNRSLVAEVLRFSGQ